MKLLEKPFLHLHTQYNREIPWSTIDMDFMNLNQSVHGDSEFGFVGSRMRLNHRVGVGPWRDDETLREIGVWVRLRAPGEGGIPVWSLSVLTVAMRWQEIRDG